MSLSDVTRFDAHGLTSYLAIYRGDALIEVIELPQSGRLTVGRSESNRIVVPDSKCSREHCELFNRGGEWFVRDLESRNGVTVDGEKVTTDHRLEFGQTIRIGSCSLVFTNQSPETGSGKKSAVPPADASYEIIERTAGTQFDQPLVERLNERRDSATALFRIAREMASVTEVAHLCQTVFNGLMRYTGATLGGILLHSSEGEDGAESLRPICISADDGTQPFSTYLSHIVSQDRDAILAHNISEHSVLAIQDSLRALRAESAICAPIRHADRLLGVIHLYSISAENPLSHDDLEFVLAVADQMGDQLHGLLERETLEFGLQRTRQQVDQLNDQLGAETELVGEGPKLQELRKSIRKVAPTDALILIRGESGVGKELVARAVHFNSLRKKEAFVCVNCAALTESLLESELFGHEKGAFTGATSRRAGKFEQANGGTLFLDEIGEMSPEIQAKFLRVLEGQPFERVGGGDAISVDVRVVTATNRDLEEAVRDGTFRKDLFFRLQVIEVLVPPLREHPEDLPAIAQHFVERFAAKSNHRARGFGTAAIRKMQEHSWPGNVRELRNVVERAVILSESEILQPEDVVLTNLNLDKDSGSTENSKSTAETDAALDTSVDPFVDLFGSFIQQETSLDDLDRYYIEAVLESADWNKSKASRILQIERTTLDRRLKKYGISRPSDNNSDEEE